MKNTIGRSHARINALGSALLVAVLGVPASAAGAASPAATVAAADAVGGNLIVRFRQPKVEGSSQRSAAALRADASPDPAQASVKLAIVEAAMRRAGVGASPALPLTTARQAAASAASTARAPQYVRTLAVGSTLIQLPGVGDADELQRVADELTADERVVHAVVDRSRHAYAPPPVNPRDHIPDDPLYVLQWHLHDPIGGIGAQSAWPLSRGEGVVVAVLDTGFVPFHPDLAGSRLLPGYDFISAPSVSRRPGFGRVIGAVDRGDWQGPDECLADPGSRASTWHGTQVIGAIGESTGNALGMSGLAAGATVLPVRVLGHCGGHDSDIVDAIVWATGGHVDGVPDNEHPAEIVNLSLGDAGACPAPYQEAIDLAVARGALVIAAAGNDGESAAGYAPGNCRNVLTVGATRVTGEVAPYSNHGARVDLAAPGGTDEGTDGPLRDLIWQASYSGPTTPNSGQYTYLGKTGTSMAAPQVAATAALVQSARVAAGRAPLSPVRLKAVLVDSARPFPVANPAQQRLGSGIVDPTAALHYALDTACDVGVESCAPPTGILRNKVPAVIDSKPDGRHYVFTAEAGRPLTVSTYGGTGNASLYVRYGVPANLAKYDGRSGQPGNEEVVRLLSPKAGTYHIYVPAEGAYRGLTLLVRQ